MSRSRYWKSSVSVIQVKMQLQNIFEVVTDKSSNRKLKMKKKWTDLVKYEGNAQGFRIITKLQNPKVKGGLNLTYLNSCCSYKISERITRRAIKINHCRNKATGNTVSSRQKKKFLKKSPMQPDLIA